MSASRVLLLNSFPIEEAEKLLQPLLLVLAHTDEFESVGVVIFPANRGRHLQWKVVIGQEKKHMNVRVILYVLASVHTASCNREVQEPASSPGDIACESNGTLERIAP